MNEPTAERANPAVSVPRADLPGAGHAAAEHQPGTGQGAAEHQPGARPAGPGLRDLPGERPPKRLLDRAPSERLREGAPRDADAGATGSSSRAVGYGIVAAGAGTLVHLGAATLLLWTGALLVVAVTIGIVTGLAVALGAASSLRARTRRGLAAALALGSIGLAIGVNWALSGIYLGPLDYLAQVYGLLVPLQLVLAASGALAGSR